MEVSFTAFSLYPWGKIPQNPLNRKLGGTRASLDTSQKRKLSPPYQESAYDSLVVKAIA
jgi:hypothetical protein